jgi:hypothetical protein
MNNISMNQALGIWSELWQAYYGDNSYGSDTAEIYAYRLMQYSPALLMPPETHLNQERLREIGRLAAQSLRDIVFMFCKEADCLCSIDGEDCDTWLAHNPEFSHRCHIYIRHKENTQPAIKGMEE